ncbi:MAG: transcriptional regulator [Chloroflexi bacterium]|nr:transcriptional regulator [Chloroflexota bacterium]
MLGNVTPGFDEADYVALVRSFPPRVIHDEHQLAATERRIDELLALAERTPAQDAYLDLLSTLVQEWEADHVDIPPVSGVELVKFLCEMHGMPQRALVPIFGTPSVVSEVLAGKRELQRRHIEGLAAYFHVSPAAFFPARTRVDTNAPAAPTGQRPLAAASRGT